MVLTAMKINTSFRNAERDGFVLPWFSAYFEHSVICQRVQVELMVPSPLAKLWNDLHTHHLRKDGLPRVF